MNARFLGNLSVLVLLGLVVVGATGPRCEPVPVEPCPPVTCLLYCEHGFAVGEDGCEICQCAPPPSYGWCETVEDCACGVDRESGDCAYGNLWFVDPSRQCPDFCTGIAGHLSIACRQNECVQVSSLAECRADSDCVIGGCSGQLCATEPLASTCEYLPWYVCFDEQYTWCGCQAGRCGWAQTEAFQRCLAGHAAP